MSPNYLAITKIINAVLHGENNFCALCFKIDQSITTRHEISILIDEAVYISLSDVLQVLFGNEMQDYLSTFENICEECVNVIIGIYKYIQFCHSNAKSITQALNRLKNSLDCTQNDIGQSKSVFISMKSENFTTELTYNDTKLDSAESALRRLNLLNTSRIKDGSNMKKTRAKHFDTGHLKISDMILDPNDEVPHCKECLKSYPTVYNLRTHFLKVHAPKAYRCSKCPKAYKSPSLVAYHMSVDHCEIICSECGKVFTNKSSFMRHELSHSLKFVCPDCGRIYKSSITYKRHIKLNVCKQECRANPADAKYTCDYCGKKYTQKMSLRVHIQYDHGNYKAHVCKWCGKKFWAQSRLKAHIVKHTKEKNFICSVCQGKFVTKESLLYHTRLHTGEKPYKCSQCDCTFISSSRRAYHMKAYHLRAMVECDVCNSKFTSRSYLNKHKKSHKECQSTHKNLEKSVIADDTTKLQSKKKNKLHDYFLNEDNELLMINSPKYSEKMPMEEAQIEILSENYIFIESID